MTNENKKQQIKHGKMGKLQLSVLMRTILPMLVMGIIITFAAGKQYKDAILMNLEKSMLLAAETTKFAFDELSDGDYHIEGSEMVSLYKGDLELTGNFEHIDKISALTGYDVSLFFGNTRILTTLKEENGNRAVATGVNAALLNNLEQQEWISQKIDVQGENYYAIYYPLRNQDHSLAGMIGIAEREADLQSEIVNRMIPLWLMAVACMLLAAWFSLVYTNGIVRDIKAMKKFLRGMMAGELGNVMNRQVLKRGDELGETAKDVVDMQNAIRVLVEQDMLTGLYNRRYGAMKFRKIIADCKKSGMPYAAAIGDIDYFKKVNDTYGHEAGDLVLKMVSKVMKEQLAGKGIVCRWGGEEFLLVFNSVDIAGAQKQLLQILYQIRDLTMTYEEQKIQVTMTFGVADGKEFDDYEQLLRVADERLYAGKNAGRNCVVAEPKDGEKEIRNGIETEKETKKEAKKETKKETETEKEQQTEFETESVTDAAARIAPGMGSTEAAQTEAMIEAILQKVSQDMD